MIDSLHKQNTPTGKGHKMGDRSVVGFRENKDTPTIYLYSHWGGEVQESELILALLKAEPRWQDSAYATRICISQMIGNEWDTETGYGISVDTYSLPDYDFIYVVEWSTGVIYKLNDKTDFDAPIEITSIRSFVDQLSVV
jgi:hypothetical protein